MKKRLLLSFTFFIFLIVALMGCDKTKDFVDPAKILPPVVTKGFAYYVSDLTGSDANNGLLSTTPLKTLTAGYNKLAAGDTLYIMNGTYTAAGSSILNIIKSGTASRYITFKNFTGHSPKFFVSGDVWNAVVINGSYIIFEGIELQGDNANLTPADALAAYNTALASGASTSVNAKYNTNGISIGGPNTESKLPHHVVIRNCKVHDLPGGGISSIQADYTTIESNLVYNNAWYMMYAGSGISILNPINSDGPDVTKYKNVVRNNICNNNKTTIPWIGLTPPRLSDGNGIIIDVNQYPYGGSAASNKPYTGRTLVENNVSYNNGGSGIHAFKADHVDIINNTAYGNGTVVGYPDIYAGSSTDVKIVNNIMYARTGGKCNAAPSGGTTVTYNYNIYFNGTVAFQGTNDKVLNPLFVNASIDPAVANFNLSAGSPAIDGGTQSIFSAKDIKGVARPKGTGVDCGAYEF
jgi:Right handed beta helix region